MAEAIIRLSVDSSALQADIELLAQAAERLPEVRELLLDAGDLAAQVRCVHLGDALAGRADEFRVRLEFSERLAELVAAVRTGKLGPFCGGG